MRIANLLVVAGSFLATVGTPSDAGGQAASGDGLGFQQAAADRTLAAVVITSDQISNTPPASYFPLATGNSWVYQGGGIWAGSVLTLEITKSSDVRGNRYFLLHGLPGGDYWLRQDDKGSVFAWDMYQATDKLWWLFQSPIGEQYRTFLPGTCCGVAVVTSRTAHYEGPVGKFDKALEINYPGVFQVGIEREVFLPGVGLAQRRQATGGPSYGTWELIYASVGGITAASAPDFSFSLALNDSIYYVDAMPPWPPQLTAPVMTARISLRDNAQPISLTFPTGQTFDFTIRNERGMMVYRWSDGRAFTQAFHTEVFGPGERNFVIQVRLVGPDKHPLPEGRYVAEGWLTTVGMKTFDASTGFEIRWVH